MEDLHRNGTAQEEGSNYTNITCNQEDNNGGLSVINVVTCVIICISLPLTLVAIYAVYSLVRKEHVAPIYVINLLVSDVIQLCCLMVRVARREDQIIYDFVFYIYNCGVIVSIFFMVCVALERYLAVAWPLWYRFRLTIKISLVVCVVVWALPPLYFVTFYFWLGLKVSETILSVFLLLPLPLFIFFLYGTIKALSANRLPADEKRRIVGILVLVLLIYTLLFLPIIIGYLVEAARNNSTFNWISFMFVRMSPLADLFLYVFMRKGTIDKLLASLCCCKAVSSDISSSSPTAIPAAT